MKIAIFAAGTGGHIYPALSIAEKFGKGDYVNDFRPSGAQEIRKAAYESLIVWLKELIDISIKDLKCCLELVMI